MKKICKCLITNFKNMSKFHPLEVVDRGSETLLQVGENLICIYFIYLAL